MGGSSPAEDDTMRQMMDELEENSTIDLDTLVSMYAETVTDRKGSDVRGKKKKKGKRGMKSNEAEKESSLFSSFFSSVSDSNSDSVNLFKDTTAEAKMVIGKKNPELAEVVSSFGKNCTTYVRARGLPVNSWSINGIISTELDLSQSVMTLLVREQFILGNWYKKGKLNDSTKSVFSAILGMGKAYPRFSKILEETSPKSIDSGFYRTAADLSPLMQYITNNAGNNGNTGMKDISSTYAHNTTIALGGVDFDGVSSHIAALEWLRSTMPASAADPVHNDGYDGLGGYEHGRHRLAFLYHTTEDMVQCFTSKDVRYTLADCLADIGVNLEYAKIAAVILSVQEVLLSDADTSHADAVNYLLAGLVPFAEQFQNNAHVNHANKNEVAITTKALSAAIHAWGRETSKKKNGFAVSENTKNTVVAAVTALQEDISHVKMGQIFRNQYDRCR